MLSFFELLALVFFLSAAFSWFNTVYLRLPQTIGLLIIALVSSLLILAVDYFFPSIGLTHDLQAVISQIDFNKTLMHGMLAFLLFAGALHVDMSTLKSEAWAIGLMATFGVLLSTFIVGFGTYFLAKLFGLDFPLIWALVFGALISPTDPVAVLSILKTVKMPKSLKTLISGESLFNDGVGVVIFSIILALAAASLATQSGHGHSEISAAYIAELFAVEALGGAVLGAIFGYIAFKAMAQINDYIVETLITLALVTATYAIAARLNIFGHHVSGPIAVVIAGLMIGNHGAEYAMSSHTQTYLFGFWEMVDEILNAMLFLLIGLEILVVGFAPEYFWLTLLIIPLVLSARFMAVSMPMTIVDRFKTYPKGTIPVLTWSGVRGGISVALALSLPDTAYKPIILACTYGVVIFSIIVQGLSIKQVVQYFLREETQKPGIIPDAVAQNEQEY